MPHVRPNGSPHYRTLFENAISSCAEAFQQNPHFMEISSKLNSLKANVFEKCCAAVECNQSGLNVLTHGDLWSNNIMFPNDITAGSGPLFVSVHFLGINSIQIICVLQLDFQMSYFGSPILDVSYLLFTSSNETITPNEFDALFDFYCEQLINVMSKLNIPMDAIPSKQQLQSEFNLRGCYGAFFSLFSVPLRMHQPMDAPNKSSNDEVKQFLSSSQDGHVFRKQIYSNAKVQPVLENLLNYFNKKQFLNYFILFFKFYIKIFFSTKKKSFPLSQCTISIFSVWTVTGRLANAVFSSIYLLVCCRCLWDCAFSFLVVQFAAFLFGSLAVAFVSLAFFSGL